MHFNDRPPQCTSPPVPHNAPHLLCDFLCVNLEEWTVHPLLVLRVEVYGGCPESVVRFLRYDHCLYLRVVAMVTRVQQHLLSIDALSLATNTTDRK